MKKQKQTFVISGRNVTLYPASHPDSPLIVLNCFEDDGGQVEEALKSGAWRSAGSGAPAGGSPAGAAEDVSPGENSSRKGMPEQETASPGKENAYDCPDHSLLCVHIPDWNRDMAPWDCPAVWKEDSSFSGGAGAYLDLLLGRIVPEAVENGELHPSFFGIAGYSLAGLFAVWSLYQTDRFTRAASMSGSFWYPGFPAYARQHSVLRLPDRLYLSLGDREARTRNVYLRTVADETLRLAETFRSAGSDTVFEWNPGGHGRQSVLRTAKGIFRLLY